MRPLPLLLLVVVPAGLFACRSPERPPPPADEAVSAAALLPDSAPTPAPAGTAPHPRGAGLPLDSADFVVAGFVVGADSGAVLRALGRPDSVSMHDNPFDPGFPLPTWHYPGARVFFSGGPETAGISLTGARHATARGARVGDPRERVRALYGAPEAGGDEWDYVDPADASGLHVIRFSFRGGRVWEVYVGWLMD